VAQREHHAEQHRAEDDAVEVTVDRASAPDHRRVGTGLTDGFQRVVPSAGAHRDLDPVDALAQPSQRTVQDQVGHVGHPEGQPLPTRAGGAHLRSRPLHLGEDHPCPPDQCLPGDRELDALRRALEERHAQFSFQGLDLLGEGRRGDVQPARRTAEAPFLGHRQEVPELAQLHEPPRYCSAADPRPGHR
jgi:hypothetical protein